MSTYIYQCHHCKIEKEMIHSIKEDPIVICDICGNNMSRKIFAPLLKFVGPGFPTNDLKDISKIHPEADKAHKKGVF